MITHKEVEKWLQEEIVKARELNIPISSDIDPVIEFPKATSFYGMCHKKDSKHPNHAYRIRISEYYLASTENNIRETLMHELLHTCPGCSNHKEKWRSWAGVANGNLGYQIERLGHHEDENFSLRKEAEKQRGKAVASRPVRYIIRCTSCGLEWKRTRRSNITMHPKYYKCPVCDWYGTLEVKEV